MDGIPILDTIQEQKVAFIFDIFYIHMVNFDITGQLKGDKLIIIFFRKAMEYMGNIWKIYGMK